MLRLVDQTGFVGDVPRQPDDMSHLARASGGGHQAGAPGHPSLRQVERLVVGEVLAGREAGLEIGYQAVRDLGDQTIRGHPADDLVERPSGEAGHPFIGVLERRDAIVINVQHIGDKFGVGEDRSVDFVRLQPVQAGAAFGARGNIRHDTLSLGGRLVPLD